MPFGPFSAPKSPMTTSWTTTILFKAGVMVPLAMTLSLGSLASASETLLLPRLGFTPYQDKRVIIVRETPPEVEAKPEATPPNEAPAALPEAPSDDTASTPDETKAATDDTTAPAELSKAEKEAQKAAEKEAKRLKEEADKKAKEEERAQRRAEKDARRALKKSKKDIVSGEVFLYSIKNKRILYHAQGKAVTPDSKRAVTRVKDGVTTVEFETPVSEGLYTVAVQGSGHITEVPMLVSESIYWDAMRPVIRDLGQNHCPSQKGKFQALQFCYALKLANESADPSSLVFEDRFVKGGWFTDSYNQSDTSFHKKAKDTAEIAKITNLLLNVYALNPESYKYLEVEGLAYKETENPDLLDEVNWGLQYLQTAQNTNGAMPEGIEQPFEFRQEYQLMADSPEATALGISALTQGAKMYQTTDNLNYAVSLIITAEKAWEYLQKNSAPAPYQFLAAASLADATGKSLYQSAAERLSGQYETLAPELKLLLGKRWVSTTVETTIVSQPTDVLPEAENPATVSIPQVATELALTPGLDTLRWGARQMESLYGYEPVKFKPEINFKLESAWRDPLAYVAYKAGERITKMSYKLEDKKVTSRDKKDLSSEFLKELEDKEATAKSWVGKGYKKLTLSPLDKAYLVYSLGLLNESLPLWQDLKEPKRKVKSSAKSQPTLEELEASGATTTSSEDDSTNNTRPEESTVGGTEPELEPSSDN